MLTRFGESGYVPITRGFIEKLKVLQFSDNPDDDHKPDCSFEARRAEIKALRSK